MVLRFEKRIITNVISLTLFKINICITDKYNTSIADWKVFLYLHDDYILRHTKIPITFQLAPFQDVSYEIALVKCFDIICNNFTKLHHHIVEDLKR